MCCGTAQNTYHTLQAMRLVLADGSVLDSEDSDSVAAFRQQHAARLQQLATLAENTRNNAALAARIRHKYRLKNTMGLSLNALVDFTDPIDILLHLMVGSEGTLGFISAVTYRTVPEYPHKATALLVFPEIRQCCDAVTLLRSQPVAAVELLDRRSLRAVQDKPGMPAFVQTLSANACALLIETRAPDAATLQAQLAQLHDCLAGLSIEQRIDFTSDPIACEQLWRIRKDTFPAVGAARAVGTTAIIEDITFPVEHLAEGVERLIALFEKHHYPQAILFGHALEGNLHFVFPQGFSEPADIARYAAFMDDVAQLVAVEFSGSLKAEHGTGRNMAPYVALEWGEEAYALMWAIKRLFDPQHILNPDVILSDDPQLHLQHLKPMPAADTLVDPCTECGFCEPVCPAHGYTLSPRQRIVVWRDIQARKQRGEDTTALQQAYQHQGIDSCAATGLCAQRCPVGIDTGALMRKLRTEQASHPISAQWVAAHFSRVTQGARYALKFADDSQRFLGTSLMQTASSMLHRLSAGLLPQWSLALPRAASRRIPIQLATAETSQPRVVYFSSCVARVMGPSASDTATDSLTAATCSVLQKAGFHVVFPASMDALCCGQPFSSKGYPEQAELMLARLTSALLEASREGRDPIYCDTSPCSLRLLAHINDPRLKIYDSTRFLHTHVIDRLHITPVPGPIALHITCSTQHLGDAALLTALAHRCCQQIVLPEGIHCCGFAGDKGFRLPALNAHALSTLNAQVAGCHEGISTSRTCEIGLSTHAGFDYHGLVYLLDRVSQALPL
jgi:D-lactate dehydrogenase